MPNGYFLHYFMELSQLRKFFMAIHRQQFLHSECACCQKLHRPIVCQNCINAMLTMKVRCIQCAKPLSAQTIHFRCYDCLTLPPAFDETRCIGEYKNALKKLILDAKQSSQVQAIQALRYIFTYYANLSDIDFESTCLVAIPSPGFRQMKRGFNLPLLLAVSLHRHYQIPIGKRGLTIPFFTLRQTTQSRRGRIDRKIAYNVTPAFLKQIRHTPNVLLIDDVLTTGSTANAATKQLKDKGAKHVTVMVLAR